ncbi:hypothetical protein SUNI508_03765 [Seiridium unicorne]|uniref:YMC020W-like alpha/beta hydrolase domain-containing protein n=1 Tax=Seiridium unicorne TaxID=138068 RepID=A0ABR2VB39_9PEZI
MSPRKRSKPNPSGSSSNSTTSLPATSPPQPSVGQSLATASGVLSATDAKRSLPRSSTTKSNEANKQNATTKEVRKSTSWYGSLGRKASASTQVARETIMGGTVKSGSTADFSRFEPRKNLDGSAESDAQSIQTMPKIPEAVAQSPPTAEPGQGNTTATAQAQTPAEPLPRGSVAGEPSSGAEAGTESQSSTTPLPDVVQRPAATSGWFGGWFGAPAVPTDVGVEEDKLMADTAKHAEPTQQEPLQEPLDGPTSPAPPDTPKSTRPTSSWLGSWWNTPVQEDSTPKDSATSTVSETTAAAKENEHVVMENAPVPPAIMESQPSAGSTWAFWSRDTGSKSSGTPKPSPEQGEIAVMGEGSEASPRRSSGVDVKDGPSPAKEQPLNKSLKESPMKPTTSKKSKRERPQSIDLDEPVTPRPATPVNKTSIPKPETPGSIKSAPPNLLLPSFRNTYRMRQNPSIIKQITQLLLRTQQPAVTHVHLVKEQPKIKKAIAIGVHGLFPATYLRPMIGQPTGTSIRFANHCAEAIRRWADSHGCEDCEIEKVALEGEGRIADRVDNLWKLLLNWIEHIRSADLILVACHSQGVPVGLMLMAKLIDLGIITTARIGICAMAGVSLGPFPDYKSGMGMLMGSAAELWQFADPSSEISQRLEHAMKAVLEHGCRVTLIGSIDDQLVPMESAIYSPASHPHIYRAVFVDGRIHAPDFIAHLVGFALKLRNLGVSDQGLVRELSVALAGSLYSGEGHSRLYDDNQVYDLAVSHALETTVVNNVPCHIGKHDGLASPNPYILPWIMRGLLEEDLVKTELSSETAELLKQFDDWKPTTKALKDIKFRLEAVRSKL